MRPSETEVEAPTKKHVLALIQQHIPDRDEGQGLVEYGLILAGVSIAALVALFALGPKITDLFNAVGASLKAS